MVRRRKKLKWDEGFTLVELMTVVALIGVLSTVAIPIYTTYGARARTAEAKIALSSMFSAETGFYAENNTYTMCLRQAGYSSPESGPVAGGGYTPSAHTYYMTGVYFLAPSVCGMNGTQNCLYYSFNNAGIGEQKCSCPCRVGSGVDSDCTFVATATMITGHIPGGTCAEDVDPSYPPSGELVDWAPLTNDTFLLGALGQVSSTNTAYDQWTIDQNKTIDNPVTGI